MSELSPKARQTLRAAREAEDPSPEDSERVLHGIARAVAGGVVLASAGAVGSKAAFAAVYSKTIAAVVSTVAVAGGITLGVRHYLHTRAPAAAPAESRSLDKPPPAITPPPAVPEAAPAPMPTPAAKARPARPARMLQTTPRLSDVENLREETRGLREVNAALQAHDPARALALLDEQEARFARGQLEQERATTRILVLCDLGRVADAAAARQRFIREHPRSPLLPRVLDACGK